LDYPEEFRPSTVVETRVEEDAGLLFGDTSWIAGMETPFGGTVEGRVVCGQGDSISNVGQFLSSI
jgi:hypothetical protein